MSPHTAWLILQGMETLPLRMARTCATPKRWRSLAATPGGRAWATRCWTPPQPRAQLAQKLLPRGAGSVFSFDIKGNREQGKEVHRGNLGLQPPGQRGRLPQPGIHPASTTHFRMSDEALAGAGISQGTIRLSIGLEDADDLIDDLKRALKAAEKAT